MRFSLIIGALGAFLFASPIPKPKSFLPAPRNLKVDILRDRFTLTWDSVRNAAAYRVYLNGSASHAESTTESRASGILNEPGVYEFAVSSTDSVGNEGARSRVKGIRFGRPWGIAVTKDGRRIVRDAQVGKQAVFDSAGRAIGMAGPDGYSLVGSYDLAVDRSGRILTARWGDSSDPGYGFVIQNPLFKVLGEYLFMTNDPSELRQPMGIGADSKSQIFVADTGNNRVQEFTWDGMLVGTIGSGELRLPMKVAFDSKDRMYVADSGNNRIAIYEKDSAGAYKLARSITGMKEPVYVAVDKTGNVFVSANRQAGVHMFAPDGKELWKYEGDSVAHLSGPRGLALDGRGNLLIVDEASLRILTTRIPYSGSSSRISSTASRTVGRGSEKSHLGLSQSPSTDFR